MLRFTAIFLAIDSVSAVFPIPGRAATIIKSLSCQPEVNLSTLSKPDGIPLRPSLLEISSIFFFAWNTKSCAVSVDFLTFPWVTSYNFDSALSKRSKTSLVSSKESSIISLEILIKLR